MNCTAVQSFNHKNELKISDLNVHLKWQVLTADQPWQTQWGDKEMQSAWNDDDSRLIGKRKQN